MPATPPALALYHLLTDAQRAKATFAPSDPDRILEQFPHEPRRGVAFGELSPDADRLILPLLQSACSAWGARQARTIMDQPRGGYDTYHLAFYGEPHIQPFDKAGMEWRISGHHLTLFGFTAPFAPIQVGPLLLGADPSILWPTEEAAIARLQAALARLPSDKKIPVQQQAGASIADLPDSVREACEQWLDERLSVYATATGEAARRLLARHGGLEVARLHFEGDATHTAEQGGRYHARLLGPSLNFWIDTRAGHPHQLLDIPGPVGQ